MTDTIPQQPTCPKGHKLGTVFGSRRCSGVSCGQDKMAAAREAAKLNPAPIVPKMPPEEIAFLKRVQVAQMPMHIQGEAATKWAKDKLEALLPEAVAQVAWDLRNGSDKVRSEAAEKVLRANGLDKREAAQTPDRAQIILNIGTGDSKSVPWLERLHKKADK